MLTKTNLLLLHGPGIGSSRQKLSRLKQQFGQDQIVSLGPEAKVPDIAGIIATPSLFSQNRLVVLENPPTDLPLSLLESSTSLVIWFDRELTDRHSILETINNLKGEVLFFKEDQEVSVFPFLDYLAGQNSKAFLEAKKLAQSGFDIYYLLNMTYFLLRNLIITPKNAPEFVKKKLARQREKFTLGQLKNLYRQILSIEFHLKSGLLDQSQANFQLIESFLLI